MVRNEAYRQSTGSFPSSGACPQSRLLVSNCLKIPHSPMLSKISLLELSRVTLSVLGHQVPPCVCMFAFLGGHSTFHRENASYYQAKQAAATYQVAKRSLLGPSAPFAGWVISGEEWESFDACGNLPSDAHEPLP